MRGASSLAYSTATPAPRRATSSMNAGGNDHSRPTRRPTRMITIRGSFDRSQLIMPTDVRHDHLPPPGPVVRPPLPDPERVADLLAPQHAGEVLVVGPEPVIASHGQDEIKPSEQGQAFRIVLVLHEVARVVEVNQLVRVPL